MKIDQDNSPHFVGRECPRAVSGHSRHGVDFNVTGGAKPLFRNIAEQGHSRPAMAMLLLAVSAIMAGCGHETTRRESRALPAVKVTVVKVEPQRVPETVEVVGTIRPVTSASIASKVMATIEKVHVNAGETVKAGQPLVELDKRDLQAEHERARADFERVQALLARDAATKSEFDAIQARYRVAETALSHARIAAPFDGVIVAKRCEPGDMATPGRALFEIEMTGKFRLEAQVPDRYAASVAVGTTLDVVMDATRERCAGVVSEVVPVSDASSRTVTVKINLECEHMVQTGQFGRAYVVTGERVGIFAPRTAVHQRGQLTYVLAAEEGRARMRLVRTGRQHGNNVEILSGLETGESIVTGADDQVEEGQPVTQ